MLKNGGQVLENQPAGTLVARFAGVDPDENDTLNYSIVDPMDQTDFPFKLFAQGGLRTTRPLDYEADDHNYTLTIQVMDERNETFEKSFTVYLINVVEDIDGDGTEDAFDEDRDGDGFSNEQEIAEGTDPDDVYSLINLPILKTLQGNLDANGSILLRGKLLADGDGAIEDFGFVLSPTIQLSRHSEDNLWIRAEEGDNDLFRLRVSDHPFEGELYFRAWAKNAAGYGVGPVKKVVFEKETSMWWGEAEELQGGWMQSPWLGTFRPYEKGWLYHARLGWLYANEAPEQSVWLWQENRGWLWTGEGIWPYLWSNHTADWLYLYPGKVGAPVFLYEQSTGLNRKL